MPNDTTITIGPVPGGVARQIISTCLDLGVEFKVSTIGGVAVDDFKSTEEDGAVWERKLSNTERVEFATTNALRERLRNVKGKDGYRPERDSATERVWHAVVLADPAGITRKSLLLQSTDTARATSSALYYLRDKGLVQQIGTKWHPKTAK